MEETILNYMNFTQLLVLVTFIYGAYIIPRTRPNRILLAILFVCLSNEIISLIFALKGINNALLVTVSVTFHHALWLSLLADILKRKKILQWSIVIFVGFAIINNLWIEGMDRFNYNTFILGALFYIGIFVFESFIKLNSETFAFFHSNHFLLLSAPILFFLGLSFIFGFRSHALSTTKIYNDIHLYALIVNMVNLVYYSIIILYIHYENKLNT